jgi:hypothetical protein
MSEINSKELNDKVNEQCIQFAYENGVRNMLRKYSELSLPGYISLYEGWESDMGNIVIDLFTEKIRKLFNDNFPKSKFYIVSDEKFGDAENLIGKHFHNVPGVLIYILHNDDVKTKEIDEIKQPINQ